MIWISVGAFIVLFGIAVLAPAYGIGPFSARNKAMEK